MSDQQSHDDSLLKAPKDKNCPFCQQAFTSSSLGRHLDLYIREKNPKPADGTHDVEAIRKIRGNITRRQARSASRREVSTPLGARASMHRGSPVPEERGDGVPPVPGITGAQASADLRSRAVSKQQQAKMALDARNRGTTAHDKQIATELALRELVGVLRSAQHTQAMTEPPFEFNPLECDFPSLTLQCLKPPPTIFSSIQNPTSSSWAIEPPSDREFHALQLIFDETYSKWKRACVAAAERIGNGMTIFPPQNRTTEAKEAAIRAGNMADTMLRQVSEHLRSTYGAWKTLPDDRRQSLWILELAREASRRAKESDALKEKNLQLTQEVAQLKAQLEASKGPAPPPTGDAGAVRELLEHANRNTKSVLDGISAEEDATAIAAKSIERWMSVIAARRAQNGGMNAQRSLETGQLLQQQQQQQQQQGSPVVPQAQMAAAAKQAPGPAKQRTVSRAQVAPKQTPQDIKRNISPQIREGMTPQPAILPSSNQRTSLGEADAEGDADTDMDASGDPDLSLDVGNLTVDGVEMDADGEMDADMHEGYPQGIIKTPMMPTQNQGGSLDIPRTRAHQPRSGNVVSGQQVAGDGRFLMQARPQAMGSMRAMKNMGVVQGQSSGGLVSGSGIMGDDMYNIR